MSIFPRIANPMGQLKIVQDVASAVADRGDVVVHRVIIHWLRANPTAPVGLGGNRRWQNQLNWRAGEASPAQASLREVANTAGLEQVGIGSYPSLASGPLPFGIGPLPFPCALLALLGGSGCRSTSVLARPLQVVCSPNALVRSFLGPFLFRRLCHTANLNTETSYG